MILLEADISALKDLRAVIRSSLETHVDIARQDAGLIVVLKIGFIGVYNLGAKEN